MMEECTATWPALRDHQPHDPVSRKSALAFRGIILLIVSQKRDESSEDRTRYLGRC